MTMVLSIYVTVQLILLGYVRCHLFPSPTAKRGAGPSLPGAWGIEAQQEGMRSSPCRGFGSVPQLSLLPHKGCRGLPAGGLGVSPKYLPFPLAPQPGPHHVREL